MFTFAATTPNVSNNKVLLLDPVTGKKPGE
jgi:hypothetical protein